MSASFASAPRLAAAQWRYQLRTMLRSPVGMFFTLVFPLVLLVLLNLLLDGSVGDGTDAWAREQFLTAGIAVFTAVSATYTNLVNVVPIRRDAGVMKRWRSTPLPTSAYLSGWVAATFTVALGGVLLMLVVGVLAYDVTIEAAKVPAMVVTFVAGVAAFAALGLAVASFVPSADTAPAIANATILPLAFVSDVFVPLDDAPQWVQTVGDLFPLKPFVHAFQDTLNPAVAAPAFAWSDLAVVAAWGVVGAVVAARRFRWEPASFATAGRTSRRRRGADAPAT